MNMNDATFSSIIIGHHFYLPGNAGVVFTKMSDCAASDQSGYWFELEPGIRVGIVL